MPLHSLRLYAVNSLITVVIALVVIDTLPQSPSALRLAVVPVLVRMGIFQGLWNLFAPDPDRTNTRLRAEISYRDGQRREWVGPDWPRVWAWEKWTGHRRREWFDHLPQQNAAPAWEPFCRYLARRERPDLPEADRGAEVKLIYREAQVPPAASRPWPSIRTPAAFDDGWVLTIEKLE